MFPVMEQLCGANVIRRMPGGNAQKPEKDSALNRRLGICLLSKGLKRLLYQEISLKRELPQEMSNSNDVPLWKWKLLYYLLFFFVRK